MAVPRNVPKPFDMGRSSGDRASTRENTHIAHVLWGGVLAQEEDAELRMAVHLMACELCRESSISLWERVREQAVAAQD